MNRLPTKVWMEKWHFISSRYLEARRTLTNLTRARRAHCGIKLPQCELFSFIILEPETLLGQVKMVLYHLNQSSLVSFLQCNFVGPNMPYHRMNMEWAARQPTYEMMWVLGNWNFIDLAITNNKSFIHPLNSFSSLFLHIYST